MLPLWFKAFFVSDLSAAGPYYNDNMPSIDIVISNKLGLHARAAAKLTQVAGRFKSEIYIARAGQRVNAKSIMGVMMLAAGLGITVTVDAEGEDAAEALEAIERLFENKFGEAE